MTIVIKNYALNLEFVCGAKVYARRPPIAGKQTARFLARCNSLLRHIGIRLGLNELGNDSRPY